MFARDVQVGQRFRFKSHRWNYRMVEGQLLCSVVQPGETCEPHVMMRVEGSRGKDIPYVVQEPAHARGGFTYCGHEAEVELV